MTVIQLRATSPGTYGSKRQSWAHKNPRDLLLAIMKANKNATEATLYSKFRAALRSHPAFMSAIVEYWFTNNYRAVTNAQQQTPAQKKALAVAHRARVKAVIGQVKLLTLVQPNGKALADCTGDECIIWGGWFARVGVRAGNRKVGDVFTEAQLRKVL